MESVDEVLAHYGVRGMRWGVRRSSSELAKGTSTKVMDKKVSGKPAWQSPPSKSKSVMDKPVKTSRRDARKAKRKKELSEDAAQFVALKQKVKQKGVQSLSNRELEVLNKRMQLQTTYSKAFPKKKNPLVNLLVKGVLTDVGGSLVIGAVTKRNPVAAKKVETAFELGKQMGVVKGGGGKKQKKSREDRDEEE